MKEKIKNFLLKIKNHLCTEIKTPVYKLLLFGLLMILLSSLCFSCSHYATEKLNEIKTEQIEEIPQSESMTIDKNLKFANPSYSYYINPNNTYNVIYCNNTLDNETVFNDLRTFYNLYGNNFIPYDGAYVYPFYGYMEYGDSNHYCMCFTFEETGDGFNIAILTFNLDRFTPYQFWYNAYTSGNYFYTAIPLPSFMLPSMIMASITPFNSFEFGGVTIPIGALNQVLFSNFSSRPFEISSTPTLENAPSSLVEDYPLEAFPNIPSNIGHQVYNSGSGSTIYSDYTELDTFGFKLFYDTETSFVNQEHYFVLDGNTFYTYEPIYQFTIKKITLVITTIWASHQIYYSFDLLESPISFYADMSGVNGGYFHDIAIQPNIVNTYADYIHINFDFFYNMGYIRNGQRISVSSVSEYGYGALIPSNTIESNYGEKGFSLDLVPQLDTEYQYISLQQMIGYQNNIIYDTMPNVYVKGQEKGENIGYSIGYDDGIETGKTLQNPLNPIMDFISDGALVISNVFGFEILPNLSLGTLLLFPLVISLIWFIIKLFMGG